MLFSDLASAFEEIEKTPSRNAMMVRIAELLKKAGANEVIQLVYLSMGSLRPKFDRLEFGLADRMVVRAIARASKETPESVMHIYKEKGDLGEVATLLLKGNKGNEVSIEKVFSDLEKIAKENGAGSQERKIEGLTRVLTSTDSVGAKYVVRIVLGKLRLGFSDKTILDALSYMESGSKEGRKALDEAYQVAPDVGELAKLVKEMGVDKAKEAVAIKLGRPMMPQLAQRLRTANEMIEKMGNVVVEPKFDGTRVQIHFSKTKKEEKHDTQPQNGLFGEEPKNQLWVKTFTRNLDENTEMFPELQKIGKQIQANEIILDSEGVGYEPKTGKMVPFQMTITRKRKHGVEEAVSTVPLKFYVFDILYRDGVSLINKPLNERRKILLETIKKTGDSDVLIVDEAIETNDPGTLREYHAKQLAKGLEGALVKKVEGKYLPGRQDWNWVKFKEEEGQAGKLSDTIDAMVLGYYKGKGKRQKFGVGAFLVGIRDEKGKVLTIAKIGTGLSDEQFVELYKRMEKIENKKVNESYVVDKMLTPDVWVSPKIVVEIAADEVTKSPVHSSGYALRFPRLVRFRDDKKVDEITTMEELKEIAGV